MNTVRQTITPYDHSFHIAYDLKYLKNKRDHDQGK